MNKPLTEIVEAESKNALLQKEVVYDAPDFTSFGEQLDQRLKSGLVTEVRRWYDVLNEYLADNSYAHIPIGVKLKPNDNPSGVLGSCNTSTGDIMVDWYSHIADPVKILIHEVKHYVKSFLDEITVRKECRDIGQDALPGVILAYGKG